MMEKFEVYNLKKDLAEENNLAKEMPEKTKELKDSIIEMWAGIEKEGPKEWWLSEKQKPQGKGKNKGKLSY